MGADGRTFPEGYTPRVEWYEYPAPAPAEKTAQEVWDALESVVNGLQDSGIDVSMPE